MKDIKIEYVPVEKLKPAKYNPRIMPEEEMKNLKRNILEFGMVDPIVVNSDMTIIGGHQRLKACTEIGMESVPVVVLEMDKDQEIALNISLNKIKGRWDRDSLADIIKKIKKKYQPMLGFQKANLEAIMQKHGNLKPFLAYKPRLEVIVECDSEAEQREVFDTMGERGFKCRVLTL